jgi:predicted RNA-binding protein with PUA-like domain
MRAQPFFLWAKQMRYWLMKSEPDEVSIDDVQAAPKKTVAWFGVRNYQARNFMRDGMQKGDLVLFYHSSCAEPGIAGIVEVASGAYPDATQFDRNSPYFDPKATLDAPRWISVDVKLVKKTRLLSLKQLRTFPELDNMRLLAKGSRLSVMPVEASEWRFIEHHLAPA